MEQYVPVIQEELRRQGFPRFSRSESREIKLGPEIEVLASTRWIFANRENSSALVVSPTFVVLEQTTYVSFDEFSSLFHRALTVIGQLVEIAWSERLGFRRVNLIEPKEVALAQMVKEGLRGLPPEVMGVTSLQSVFEERGQTPVGELAVRFSQPVSEPVLPPDLAATTLGVRTPVDPNAQNGLLDIDHFTRIEKDFNPDAVIDVFWKLHTYSDTAFRESVTSEALDTWR